MHHLTLSRRSTLPCPSPPTRAVALLAAFVLSLVSGNAGCGRRASPDSASVQDGEPRGGATPAQVPDSRRPTVSDITAFLRAEASAAVGVLRFDVQADPPAPTGAGAWTMQAKLTPVAEADLFTPAGSQEAPAATELRALEEEREALARWAERFAPTPFARRRYLAGYPAVPAPRAGPAPAWLVRRTERGQRLPALYVRYRAEWQVDRWNFTPEAPPTPAAGLAALEQAGEPRERWPADAVVAGSPEAKTLLESTRQLLAQARDRQTRAEAAYGEFLATATAPGARYVGQVSQPKGPPFVAEVRFVAPPAPSVAPPPPARTPPDKAVGRPVAFEVCLPEHPDYGLTFAGTSAAGPPLEEGGPDLRAVCTRRRGELGSPLSSALGNLLRGAAGEPFGNAEKRFTLTEAGGMGGGLSAFNGDYHLAVKRVP